MSGAGSARRLCPFSTLSPGSKGVVFDQAHVTKEEIPHERLKAVGGNFFEWAPPGGDAYLLRFVLHDWSDENAATILRCLRRAMKPSATLILAEWVIPEGREENLSKWPGLHMMVMFEGARERTHTEHRRLLAAEGFEMDLVNTYRFPR